ncbi:MAG: cellulose-binding protein, partial [Pontibacter sp.]|nr:cellulose-binding protein [Pontibacter sp.]
VESTIREVEELVKEIRKKNPLVTILLAQLIPIWYDKVGGATVDRLNSFNAQIPPLAQRLNTPESPVIVVDQFTGFDPTPNADTWDGIHPNSSGEEKMAQKWYDALDPVITPLPVELVSFSARSNAEGHVALAWQTSSETDNAYFEIQRSDNGKTFTPIGRVEGAGTTSIAQSYTYTDSSAMGEVYYRLRQVDTDSTHNYSNVVQVRLPDRAVGLQVFPTSSSGQHLTLHLQHNSTVPEADVLIYTSEGRLVHQIHNVASDRGSVRTRIPTHELHGAGLYLVRVVTTDRVYHTEFVVER